MTEIRELYELQEVDLRLDGLRKRLDEAEARLADDSTIEQARQRLAAVDAHAAQVAAQRRSAERALQALRDRLESIQQRLYSGTITSVKEMEAAEEEQSSTEGRIDEREERLLELMIQTDDVEETLVKGRQIVGVLDARRQTEVKTLTRESRDLREEIEREEPIRDELEGAIAPALLRRYDALRANKGGQAVAMVERGLCAGCKIALSTSELQRVRSAPQPMRCGACQRMLYLP